MNSFDTPGYSRARRALTHTAVEALEPRRLLSSSAGPPFIHTTQPLNGAGYRAAVTTLGHFAVGFIPGLRAGDATVTLSNTGDADLPAGATVGLYASRSATVDDRSVRIGRAALAQPVAAGATVQVVVATPLKSPRGALYLIATVDDHSGSGGEAVASRQIAFPAPRAKQPTAHRLTSGGPLHGWPAGA